MNQRYIFYLIILCLTVTYFGITLNGENIIAIIYLISISITIFNRDYFWTLVISIVLLPFQQYLFLFNSYSIVIVFYFIILLKVIPNMRINSYLFIGFILYLIYLTMISRYNNYSIFDIADTIISWFFLFIIFFFSKNKFSEKQLERLVYIPLINMPLIIYQLINKPYYGFHMDRLGGPFFQSNVFSFYMVQFLLLTVLLFFQRKNKKYLFLAILYSIIILFTQSRMGFFNMTIVTIVSIVLFSDKGKVKSTLSIISVLFLTFMMFQSKLYEDTRYSKITIENLQNERIVIWENYLKQLTIQEKIFGGGWGKYLSLKRNELYYRSTHSFYISMIITSGIVILSIFVSFILYSLYKLYKNTKKLKYYQNNQKNLLLTRYSLIAVIILSISIFSGSWALTPYASLLSFALIGQFLDNV